MGERRGFLVAGVVALLALCVGLVWHRQRAAPRPARERTPVSAEQLGGAMPALLEAAQAAERLASVTIDYPLDAAVFPPGFPPPMWLWHDAAEEADTWLIDVGPAKGGKHTRAISRGDAAAPAPETPPKERHEVARGYKPTPYQASARRWRPDAELWGALQRASTEGAATVAIIGFNSQHPTRPLSRGVVSIHTSPDPVGAPIFYRDVPLPFIHAFKNLRSIRWRLGEVTSAQRPPALLADMNVCGNCHSFTADGKTLAMDVDYGNDKGSYVITAIEPETVLTRDKVVTWSDYRREDGKATFGFLSQISPDGRHVLSTVKDRSVFSPVPDLYYSQRFFPVKGILVVYDRTAKRFFPLRGADDPRYVQSNPVWSPDGKTILFVRAEVHELKNLKDRSAVLVLRDEAQEFFEGGEKFRYDLYRISFHGGKGGTAEPLPGASGNGKSNYFPKFSPDGKWIVFCRADTFMLLQPDSTLYIMPAQGGPPRKMRCNLPGTMNSWHSWSPNGRWLVFASKANGPYTQLWLAHVDAQGNDAPPVLLEHFTAPDRAANIPEFVNTTPEKFAHIRQDFADYNTYFHIALRYERLQQHPEAIAAARQALIEKPDHLEANYLLASCLARTGREAEAIPHVRKVLELDADHRAGHRLLGTLLSRQGNYGDAMRHLQRALKIKPDDVVTANNIAWLLATCPDAAYRDGPRAVELAERACKATNNSVAVMLDSLAAAYAEVGRFPLAAETARRALAIARRKSNARTRDLELRLRLYQVGRAYRQPSAAR